jgi:hypothetical protein
MTNRQSLGLALLLGCAPLAVAATGAAAAAPEVVVRMADLGKDARYEFQVWKDAGSPGGVVFGTPNTGEELDPPPENDPNVRFTVPVVAGVAYRCWLHMKVAPAKGKSTGNVVYAQFTEAVDAQGKPSLRPKTGSFLTLEGPAKPGWAWVSGARKPANGLVRFAKSGEVTVRLQAGMEGVGFDQLVLSPARWLEKPPSGHVAQSEEESSRR